MIAMLALALAATIFVALWLAETLVRREAGRVPARPTDRAEALLADRYAHHEIDANEYWKQWDRLRGQPR